MSPAKWWRADGGYQDAPKEREHQAHPPAPFEVQGNMCCCQSYKGGYGPMWAPWMMPQRLFVQGPVPVAGVCSPPPPYAPACLPPQAPADAEKPKEEKKQNPWAPPKLPDGANYMFDGEHTMLHIFRKAAPIWNEKYRAEKLKFKMFKVGVNFTVKMVIEQILKKEGGDCKGWAATEAVERGDGRWAKGTTIEYDNDKSSGTLKSMGWSAKRGDLLPPVWVVVHKVDFK